MRLSQAPQTAVSLKTRISIGSAATLALCALMVLMVVYNRRGEGRLPGYEWRRPLAVDTALVSGRVDLTDIGLYVQLSAPDLRDAAHGGAVQHALGYDIRFTRSDGATPLYHVPIRYDGTTGTLEVWLSLDTLYGSRPAHIYLYYGNARVHTQPQVRTAAHVLQGFMIGEEVAQPQVGPALRQHWIATEQNSRQYPGRFWVLGEAEHVAAPDPATYDYLRVASRGNTLMLVEWATSTEYDNDYFEIERSQGGKHFESLGRMGGGNDSRDLLRYTFNDPRPLEGVSYYRLRQTSNGGNFTFSDIVEVRFDPHISGIDLLGVTPLAFQDALTLHYRTGRAEVAEVAIYTAAGQPVWKGHFEAAAGEHMHHIDQLGDLAPGSYVLTLMGQERKMKTARIDKR
ncbi:MAG: hypothetical protein OHK0039_43030 [Bacteroidia bacterium]